MASIKRAVENSLDAAAVGDPADRLAEIYSVNNLAKRAGLLAVHAVVARFPETAANYLGLDYQSESLMRLDSGMQANVFRQAGSDTVLKVIKEQDEAGKPKILTHAERKKLAAQLEEEHGIMASCIGSAVIPHEITVGRHPIHRDREAIRITQPYCDVDFLALCDDEDTIDPLCNRLRAAQKTYPSVIEELGEITPASRAMFGEYHLATDIVGRNIGMNRETGSIVIVDSQPVPADRAADQVLVGKHFDRLESALAVVAL